MDAKTMAENMFPAWTLGLMMLYLVKDSKYSYLLRVDKKGLLKFARFLLMITVIRFCYFKYIAPQNVIDGIKAITAMLPWQTMPGVFWEDACHALPLVLLAKMFSKERWYKWLSIPLLAAVSISFGLGHSYEGIGAVAMMTAYVPITMRLGQKYGFGTIMLCHVAYDMLTIFSFKLFLGA